MQTLDSLAVAFRNPRRIVADAYSTVRKAMGGVNGLYIPDADWDTLIILDACRYDLFEETNTLPGELSAVTSLGTHTGEFINQNFAGGEFDDIVYISANPRPSQHGASFHDVIHLWEEGWDEDVNTVPPETVTEAALAVHKQYPHKRIIVHYIQPHYPFIGDKGQQFHNEYGYTSLAEDDNLWLRLRRNEIDSERVWEIYRENLSVTLPHIRTLLDEISGRIVVSSDHGNAFGEWGVWGHPSQKYIEPLVTVPWLVYTNGQRRDIRAGGATEEMLSANEAATKRLKELGYV